MKKIIWLFLTLLLCGGFRTFIPHNVWGINNSSSSAAKLFVVYSNGSQELENDLPSDDPLGTGTVTIAAAMNSIFNDYNNIQGAYVTLVDSSDGDFATQSNQRIITIVNAAPEGTNGGQAEWDYSGGVLKGCRVVVADRVFESGAKAFVGLITHEIGHCLGLDHPQDTSHAVMSYFSDSSRIFRLQDDDKMGLIFLYPVDPSKAQESATWGMSCARRE